MSEESPEYIAHPPFGSTWRHKNGNLYEVLSMTNLATQKPEEYPITVVYRGANGLIWSRPLSRWHASMTFVPTEDTHEESPSQPHEVSLEEYRTAQRLAAELVASQAREAKFREAIADHEKACTSGDGWTMYYDVPLHDALDLPQDDTALREYVATAINEDIQNPWKCVLATELIVDGIFAKKHESNPVQALRDVIEWNVQVALDPKVSERMCERLKAERERCAQKIERSLPLQATPWNCAAVIRALEDE